MGSTEVTNQSINLDPVWSVYVMVDALGSELDMRVLLLQVFGVLENML